MPDAIRTRCKFRVVGVEDTEYEVGNTRVYSTEDEYESLEGSVCTEHASRDTPMRQFKVKHTGVFHQNVRFAASYDTANPEDVSFAEATPSGELKIYVSNPVVIGTFKPGKTYYLDLIPCE